MSNDHILLVGFMGSGKTSVSKRLSQTTGLSLIDVDYRIESIERRKIKRIFAEEGEEGFRAIETRVLAGLANEDRAIISCGGGIVGSARNRELLRGLGTVIYLRVDADEAISRISNPSTRPMLQGERPVADILAERIPLYEEVADITIDTAGKSIHKVSSACKAALEKRGLL